MILEARVGFIVCLAIDLVVAWRLVWLSKLGRESPDASVWATDRRVGVF